MKIIKYVTLIWKEVIRIWPNQADETGPVHELFNTSNKIKGIAPIQKKSRELIKEK